jgi:hypothetical protein
MNHPSDDPQPTDTVPITGLGELIGALPILLGFPPVDSLIIITHTNGEPHLVATTIRADLPDPEDTPSLLVQLRDVLVVADVAAVTVAVITDEHTEAEPLPHRSFVDAINRGLHAAGVSVQASVWAPAVDPGAPWRCYEECRCSGVVHDMRHSPLAAAQAVKGGVTFDSREQFAATLAAGPADDLDRRAAMLDACRHSTPPLEPDHAYRLVQDVIEAATRHPGLPTLTDTQTVDLARALSHRPVLDRFLMATPSRNTAAERVWTALTRATPPPARALPALLLGTHAYFRGDGVLAGLAFEHAENADPDLELAVLMREALLRGIPPAIIRRFLDEAK